jgi:hypothetical protein
VTWLYGGAPGTGTGGVSATCSTGPSPCGYYYAYSNPVLLGGSSDGWHGYPGCAGGNSSTCAQAYLNTFTATTTGNPTFALTSGAGLFSCTAPNVCASTANGPAQYFRAPVQDNGYFLSTTDSPFSSGPGITLNFGNQSVKTFSMYWGSVDFWNTVTFRDMWGNPYSVSGYDLYHGGSGGVSIINGNNVNSIVATFQVRINNLYVPLRSVSFSSCAATVPAGSPNCAPAFEFDNIYWFTCGANGCTAPDPGPLATTTAVGSAALASALPASPTPEPSGLVLMGSGIIGAAAWLRRRLNSSSPD